MGRFRRSSGSHPFRAMVSRSGKRHIRAWMGLVGMLCMLGIWPGMVHAEEDGSIQGVIQRDGEAVAEHRIMLIRFGPNQDVQRTPGQTDTQGRFSFDNLEAGKEFAYVVGIRYEGQFYRGASITLESGQHRTGVLVEVGQGAAQVPGTDVAQPMLHIVKHVMVVALQEDHLAIREMVTLRYTGSKPYTGPAVQPGHASFSLHFPLPQGYANLRSVQGLEAKHIHSLPSGLYYAAPLPPGEHRVVYTYTLPFRDEMTVIFTDRTLPTAVFDIFVEDSHLVAASDLQFGGRIDANPHAFLHYRGTDLAVRTRSWLQLTRRTVTTPWLLVGTYGLVLCIALSGIAIPSYGAWRSRVQPNLTEPMTPAQMQELHATRGRLLQTIALLDDQHEAGTLDKGTYWQRRQSYKKQLIELVEHLHNIQQHKDDRP
jgi:hypothetical protein